MREDVVNDLKKYIHKRYRTMDNIILYLYEKYKIVYGCTPYLNHLLEDKEIESHFVFIKGFRLVFSRCDYDINKIQRKTKVRQVIEQKDQKKKIVKEKHGSLKEAILKQLEQGITTPTDIANNTGASKNYVKTFLYKLKKKGGK